jgi:hypothetical protein
VFVRCGLRLTGLAVQGSIPWACVGLGAFFTAVSSRLLNPNLLVRKRRMPMTTKHNHHVFAASVLDVVSGTGTGIAAGALLA